MNTTMNIRKFRLLNALKSTKAHNLENDIQVDDIHTLIEKAVYGIGFTSVVINPEVRLKQIKGWQAAMEHIEHRIIQSLDEINYLSDAATSSTSSGFMVIHDVSPDITTTEVKSTSPKSLTKPVPPFVQTLLNITPGDLITLGPNSTKLSKSVLSSIDWNTTDACIVRRILMEVFDRQTLATHSLSGKPSPAFIGIDKRPKMQLNPDKVEDIIYFITNSLNMSKKQVRRVITIKCADEVKFIRMREEKKLKIQKI